MEEKATSKEPTRNPIALLLSGRLLTQDTVVKHLPYLLFLAFLCILYIANGYLAESSIRQINRTQGEIKELRSEQISIKSELNNTIIESELNEIIQDRQLGLSESFEPPKKIILNASELEEIN